MKKMYKMLEIDLFGKIRSIFDPNLIWKPYEWQKPFQNPGTSLWEKGYDASPTMPEAYANSYGNHTNGGNVLALVECAEFAGAFGSGCCWKHMRIVKAWRILPCDFRQFIAKLLEQSSKAHLEDVQGVINIFKKGGNIDGLSPICISDKKIVIECSNFYDSSSRRSHFFQTEIAIRKAHQIWVEEILPTLEKIC
jgi:hypothetical protein